MVLRITATAGPPPSRGGRPTVWMAARPLPDPEPRLLRLTTRMDVNERGASVNRHKMLNYWERRVAFEDASRRGWDDCLLGSPEGLVWEAARSSLILLRDAPAATLITPRLAGPVLPGIMREVTLEVAAAGGMIVEQRDVRLDELAGADAVLLANSVRGLRPVGEVDGRVLATAANCHLVDGLAAMVGRELGLG